MSTSPKRTRRSRNKLGRGLSALVDTGSPLPTPGESTPPVNLDLHDGSDESTHKGRVLEIKLKDLHPNINQPRAVFDEEALSSLAASIQESGLMQPIVVRPREAGGYEIIAGERRWRACRIAGLESVPAVLREVDDQQSAQWAMIENIQREDLNAIERAIGYQRLSERFSMTQQEIATRMGVSRVSVSNTIRLLDLEDQLQEMLIDGRLSAGHAKALLQCADPERRRSLAEAAAAEGWTVRLLERAAGERGAGSGSDENAQNKGEADARVGSVLADLEQQLSEYLGTRVMLKTNKDGTKGRVQLEFYDLDHFDGLMSKIGFTPSET